MGVTTETGEGLKAEVEVDLDCCPLTEVSRSYPDVSYSVVEKQDLESGSVVTSLHLSEGEGADGFLESLGDADGVQELQEVGSDGETGRRVRLNMECPSCLVRDLAERGDPIPESVGFDAGKTRLSFALSGREELRSLMEAMEELEAGVDGLVELERGVVGEELEEASGLTERQVQVLQYAYENGYFDRSRGVNIGEIADEFELHPSTVSSHLRAGMSKLLQRTL